MWPISTTNLDSDITLTLLTLSVNPNFSHQLAQTIHDDYELKPEVNM